MKNIFRPIALLVVICLMTSLLASCGGKKNTEDDGAKKTVITKDYVITVPDRDKVTSTMAKDLKNDIFEATGISLMVSSDWVANESEIPQKEIIVGRTSRSESEEIYSQLGQHEWTVTAKDEKIIIAGTTVKALSDAIRYFVDTYVSGKTTVEMEINAVKNGKTKLILFEWKDGKLINTGINGGYPRLYALKDGTLLLAYDGMYVRRSENNGLTWGPAVKASLDYPGTANAALFQDEDGVIYLGFRSTGYNADKSFFANIHVTCSKDNGKTWQKHSTVYENTEPTGAFKGVWEPHFGMMNGKLTCFYANDSTNIIEHYQNIEYKQWDPNAKKWDNRTVVCDGKAHQSRDGMPVWQQLSTGEYVCVIEAFNKDDNNCFAIKLTWSDDGKNWSEPVTVMRAKKKGTACAAPYIVELPNGQIVISCQTNEKTVESTKENYIMSTVISDGTPVKFISEENFSSHDYPCTDLSVLGKAMWNGMYVHNGFIFTCSIANDSMAQIKINRFKFSDLLE